MVKGPVLFLLVVIHFHFIKLSQTKLQNVPLKGALMRTSLQECILNATRRFFDPDEALLYSLPLTELDANAATTYSSLTSVLIPELQRYQAVVVRKADEFLNEFEFDIGSEPFENYMIQIRHAGEFQDHLERLVRDQYWNPHAKFMVISLSIFENPLELATIIIKKFWKVQVINCVVILPNVIDPTSFNVFTWYPYSDQNCGDDFTNTSLIDSCSFGNREQVNLNWFAKDIPKKLNWCIIEARIVNVAPFVMNIKNDSVSSRNDYFDSKGIDVNMMNVVAEQLNVQMHYVSSAVPENFGNIFENGTVNGELFYIHNHLADVVLGGYAVTIERKKNFDSSVSYYQESVHWCVPHSPIPDLDSLLNVITVHAWILIFFFYLIVTILLWLSSQRGKESTSYKLLGSCFLNSYGILVCSCVAIQPKTAKTRFVAMLLLMANFYLISAYQTIMMSALSNKDYGEEIASEEDILLNDVSIYTLPFCVMITDKYGTGDNEILSKIVSKWKICHNSYACIERVGVVRDSVFTLPKSLIKYILKSYLSSENEPLITCLDTVILSHSLNIIMRKGFPLFSIFDDLIHNMAAAGLIERWEREIDDTNFKKATRYDVEINGSINDGLDFFSLQQIFFMLLLGEALALVAFFAEIAFFKWLQNTKASQSRLKFVL